MDMMSFHNLRAFASMAMEEGVVMQALDSQLVNKVVSKKEKQ